MLEKIFHLATGYAEFEILGDPVRFLNLAARSGFGFWNFSRREGKASVCCRPREYRRLRPLARRCRVRLRCVKKQGLPFQFLRLWRRKGLLAGMACGIGLYCFLSGFVWGVSVSGTELLSDQQVLTAAGKSGVYQGAWKSDFSPKLAARGIIGDLPELKWASVNTDGCFAEVIVQEGEKTPSITDDSRLSNIVAVREGTVVAIEAERGRPEVKLGETVSKGQLLISGLYQEKLNPYNPPPEVPYQSLGAARGRVIAETYRTFTVQVSAIKREKVPSGQRRINSYLTLFGIRVPLGLNSVPKEECRITKKDWTLKALDTPLPVSFQQEVYEFLEETERSLTEKELKEAALLKLRKAQRAEIPAGGRVLREELEYIFPDGMCILNAKCRCEEEIGIVQPVLVDLLNFDEKF